MHRSPLFRALLTSAAIACATALAGCNTDGTSNLPARAMKPLPAKLVADIEHKQMDKESPILVRVFKEESELEIWKQDRSGRFALLKTYPICRWSGELGPKIREGDRQAPEGFYTITPGQMNPNSSYFLSFDLGYPNAFDRAHGRTGAHLMVHGDCSSRGCYSMTDEQIAEIYALGREAFFGGQRSFQVQAYPFRMTATNMARHRGNPHMPFWKMLKQGNDHFEVSKLEPKVNVCDKRYVFNAESPDLSRPLSFNASARCPVFEVPHEIASAVSDKQRRDDVQIAALVSRGITSAPVKTNADGGMHPVFVAAVKRNEVGVAPTAYSVASLPGTVPATVRPPRTADFADHPTTTTAMAPEPQPYVAPVGSSSSSRVASTDTGQAQTTGSANLFGGLFSSSSSSKNEGGVVDRVARLVGLRGSDTAKTTSAAAVPTPRPKPQSSQSRPVQTASHGAIRPKPQSAPSDQVKTATATPPPAAPAKPSVMNGAAPTVPVGNFDSRWSAFR